MKLNDKEVRFAVEELSRCIAECHECYSLLTAGETIVVRTEESIRQALEDSKPILEMFGMIMKLAKDMRTYEPDSWICPDEASLISGWSVKSLRKYASEGVIRCRKVHKNVLYLKEDIVNIDRKVIQFRNRKRHRKEYERMKMLTPPADDKKKE